MRTEIEFRDVSTPIPGRLDSWKEIAAYFGKNVRTVQRWEAESELPVHRVPGRERGSVFAYVGELQAWLEDKGIEGNETSLAEPVSILTGVAPGVFPIEAAVPTAAEIHVPVSLEAETSLTTGSMAAASVERRWVPALIAAALIVMVGSVWVQARSRTAPPPLPLTAVVSPATDSATQDLYFRGRYLWNLRTEESLTQAAKLFTQAIAKEPRYAPAYAGLADSYLLLRQFGHMPDAEAYPRAYAASRQALALDDSSAEAHRTYGFVLTNWLWNFPAAEAEFKRAIELDPRNAQSHHWYATSLYAVGRLDDALKEIDIARALQPDSIAILANRGLLLRTQDPEKGLEYLLQLEQANPGFAPIHRYIAEVYLDRKEYAPFLKEMREKAEALHRDDEAAVIDRAADALAKKGERAMLIALGEGYGRIAETPPNQGAIQAAEYYARLGDADRTLHYLTEACAWRESSFHSLAIAKGYGFLAENAKFEALLVRSRTPIEAPAEPAGRSPLQVAAR